MDQERYLVLIQEIASGGAGVQRKGGSSPGTPAGSNPPPIPKASALNVRLNETLIHSSGERPLRADGTEGILLRNRAADFHSLILLLHPISLKGGPQKMHV